MTTESLPLMIPYFMVDGQVDKCYVYQLRLTPMDRYTIDDIVEMLDQFDDWVVSEEQSKKDKLHYHCLIYTDSIKDVVQGKVQEFVYRFWPQRGRGFGVAQYQLQVAKDAETSLVYLLKDNGATWGTPVFTEQLLDKYRKKSYPKFSKDEFAKEFDALKAQWKTDEWISVEIFMEQYGLLKSKYRQGYDLNQLYKVALSNFIHRRPDRLRPLISDFMLKKNSF